jgi:hypothetical protein
MEKRDTIEVLGLFAAARPGLNFESQTVDVYHLALQDLPAESVKRAAFTWLQTNADERQWLPTIAELRRLATHDPTLPPAIEAWADLERSYSPYADGWEQVTAGNRLAIAAAEATFGSGRFGPDAYIPRFDEWNRKAFIEAYDTIGARDQRERQLGLEAGPVRDVIDGLAKRKQLPRGDPHGR